MVKRTKSKTQLALTYTRLQEQRDIDYLKMAKKFEAKESKLNTQRKAALEKINNNYTPKIKNIMEMYKKIRENEK